MGQLNLEDLFGETETTFDLPIPAVMAEAELADFLGLATASVRDLARNGTAIKTGRGRYDVRQSTGRYIARLRDHASKAGRPVNSDLAAEKLRLAKEQADKLELSNQAARRELLPASEVEREWSEILRHLRAAILALPSRIGQRVPALTQTDLAAIDGEIRDLLGELSNGD
jgi:phage terminase Nu1 subunit (DNA packaging protein)